MKLRATILLIIFCSFITVPAILSGISSIADVSLVFNMAEEENHNHSSSKIFYDITPITFEIVSLNTDNSQKRISEEFFFNHKNSYYEIPYPPPDQKLV